ncbi:branched-chain amino acid ABC transporter permease [Ramlibacter sp.]|uniref:branched-chain amino acid ABC transporter permease n=1 Tax=Ramlibacter sp. TaxID=1917967 RepID=UPI003D0DE385
MIGQVLVNAVVLGSSLALLSVGFTLAYGVMHVVNFAHGAVYMLGAYGVFILSQQMGLPFGIGLLATIAIVAALAPLLHWLLFRHVYGKFMDSLMVTIGLTLVIQGLAQLAMGPEHRNVRSYLGSVIHVGGVAITAERLVVVVAALASLAAVYFFVVRTKLGLAIRAAEQDAEVAGLHGVNLDVVSIIVLAISFALAAAAGAIMSPLIFIDPYIGEDAILLAFAVVILGGLGSVAGSLLAAMALGLTLSIAQTYLSLDAGRLIFFALVGAILLIRPSGLLGRKTA